MKCIRHPLRFRCRFLRYRFAIALARNDIKPTYGTSTGKMAVLATERMNNAFLPDIAFPDALEIESDLVQAIAKAKDILIVVPSHVFARCAKTNKALLSAHHRIMWATKDWNVIPDDYYKTVAQEILGNQYPLAVLSGPNLPKNSLKVYRQLSHYPQQTANCR
ncbi:NAD(P)H-dependent glycerol-3-phosphate dehydrogenase [Actinobacillus pleuropneumoniae]|nr:NAD(P)H-dependent glycerol-3-phosphate dehydrogenase [Actinobacillus pleuropneumoniae]